MHQCSRGRRRLNIDILAECPSDGSMNMRGRKESLASSLSPSTWPLTPAIFYSSAGIRTRCKRGAVGGKRSDWKKRAVLVRERGSRARSCRSLSTCLSCDQSSALSRACARRSGRCVGARLDFTRFTRGLSRAHTHISVRVRPRFYWRIASRASTKRSNGIARRRMSARGLKKVASSEAEAFIEMGALWVR